MNPGSGTPTLRETAEHSRVLSPPQFPPLVFVYIHSQRASPFSPLVFILLVLVILHFFDRLVYLYLFTMYYIQGLDRHYQSILGQLVFSSILLQKVLFCEIAVNEYVAVSLFLVMLAVVSMFTMFTELRVSP